MLDTDIFVYIMNQKPATDIEHLELLEQNNPEAIFSRVLSELPLRIK